MESGAERIATALFAIQHVQVAFGKLPTVRGSNVAILIDANDEGALVFTQALVLRDLPATRCRVSVHLDYAVVHELQNELDAPQHLHRVLDDRVPAILLRSTGHRIDAVVRQSRRPSLRIFRFVESAQRATSSVICCWSVISLVTPCYSYRYKNTDYTNCIISVS